VVAVKVLKMGNAEPGWDCTYIGRGSKWGNPYVIGKDGDRDEVIAKFRAYAEVRLKHFPDWLEPLEGQNLLCFCAPLPCHGDVLVSLIKGLEESEFCGEECPSFHGGSCACRNSDDPRDRSE
jgi:hypothetical protein